MRKNMLKILLLSAAMILCFILGARVAFAQCGADGKQPCNPTPKTTTPKKITPKTTTPKKTTPRTRTVSKPKPTTKKPPTTVSKPQPEFVASAPEIEMVEIPSGSFMMGSENGEDSEKPVHRVNISSSFYMGKYEVTQTQWKAVMGNNPSDFSDCGGDCPVEQVSWEDAQEFIRKLNDLQIEYEYRLPTEAEWEYACRAGTTGDYAGDLDEMAWYYNNSGDETLSGEWSEDKLISNNNRMDYVGTKQANAWGLYDMHGNVWEWCEDWYGPYSGETVTNPTGATSGSDRVFRGGGWDSTAEYLRSAYRYVNTQSVRGRNLGFRVVRTANRTAGAISKAKLPNGAEMSFAYIPAGEFQMGSNTSENEKPIRTVKISQGYFMGQTEVTQAQWQAVMGSNPSNFEDCPNCPVEQVSWDDAQQFIAKLNGQNDGYKYRLPTEAEWEYAARAGTTGDYAGSLDAMGWYDTNSGGEANEVGAKQANAWNLYDMHGNVWEWCQDRYGDYPSGSVTDPTGAATGSYRVHRGGSWVDSAEGLRSAVRDGILPSSRRGHVGFRVVRLVTL